MKSESIESIPVSIIVPVYNVEDWIDHCMESVVKQTFCDFEVILVNDGSTDNSKHKCENWAQKDNRIRVITKDNEGPSVARNTGIINAKGEYLVFLDADDWLDENFLLHMYQKAISENAEMVECDVYRVNNDTGKMTYRVCSGIMGRPYTLEEHMKYGYTAIWKCMFAKDLLVRNQITFPDCHSEARAIYALLLAKSNKVVNVKEALYYYRRFRKGSLSSTPRTAKNAKVAVGLEAFDYLLDGFKRCGIDKQYEALLPEIVKVKMSDLLAGFFYRWDRQDFKELMGKYRDYIAERFPGSWNESYVNLGGYNLNRVLWHMNNLHNPYGRFNFSSLISIVNPVSEQIELKHQNKYRQIMLNREMNHAFWSVMKEEQPHFLFLDLIEERFDILAYRDGYLTKSDAYDGCENQLKDTKLLSRTSQECMELWKQSCLKFIEIMRNDFPNVTIVLVKNYLCEKYGDIHGSENYETIAEIQGMNVILKEYYTFFVENCPSCRVVEASDCEYYFTDKAYEYGVLPSHLNEIVNRQIAKKIETEIEI